MSSLDAFDPRVLAVFGRGEAFDSEGFASLFAPRCVYQFASAPVATEPVEIVRSVAAFFRLVEALYHDIREVRTAGDTAWVLMDVLYWRRRGGLLVLPCLDFFRFDAEGRVVELRIGMDATGVGEARMATLPGASVFRTGEGVAEAPCAHPMRRWFAETIEGRARVGSGYPPKWAEHGPQWAMDAADIAPEEPAA